MLLSCGISTRFYMTPKAGMPPRRRLKKEEDDEVVARHCEYHSSCLVHLVPAMHSVGPCQFNPPHWPHSIAMLEEPGLDVGAGV